MNKTKATIPIAIKFFEFGFLGALAIGAVVSFLTFSTRAGTSGNDLLLVSLIGLDFFLVLLISRGRNNQAKWILVTVVLVGLPFYVSSLIIHLAMGFIGVLSSMELVVQLGSMCLLFTAESRRWLER